MSLARPPPLPPFAQPLPGTDSVPPGPVFMYRVGEPLAGAPVLPQRCRNDGTPPLAAARKAGEWQMWMYEKKSCFLGFCRGGGGIWMGERLCENESWFSQSGVAGSL